MKKNYAHVTHLHVLIGIPGVKNISMDVQKPGATIDMEDHILADRLKAALKGHPKYQFDEKKLSKWELHPHPSKSESCCCK